MEFTVVINLEYIAYLLMGFGVGYIVVTGVTGGPTSLDRAKHDIAVKKEFFRMRSEILKEGKNGKHSRIN